MPVKKKSTTSTSTGPDPLWLELAELEGINPNTIDKVAAAKVREDERDDEREDEAKPEKRYHKGREFRHPEDLDALPGFKEQFDALSFTEDCDTKGYGFLGLDNAPSIALDLETKLYNAWVRWYCLKHKLRPAGTLSEADYRARYWDVDDSDD